MWRVWIPLLLAAVSSAQTVTEPENLRYFPIGVFAGGPSDSGDLWDRWFTEQLRGLREPSLFEGSPSSGPVYRFTWLRSFHHPIAVRLTIHAAGGATVTVKMGAGQGGYKPGDLVVDSTREISAKETKHALDLLDAMQFWTAPPELHLDEVDLDGAEWIVEASAGGRYHVIDRWSPKRGPVREFGLYLVNVLGKLSLPGKDIY